MQPNTHPEILHALARHHIQQQRDQQAEREQRIARLNSLAQTSHGDGSLGRTAVLSSHRRARGLSQRSLQTHLFERETNPQENERERWYRRSLAPSDNTRYEHSRQAWRNSQTSSTGSAAQLQALRSHYLENPGTELPSKNDDFERVISYMHCRMRASDDDSDSTYGGSDEPRMQSSTAMQTMLQ